MEEKPLKTKIYNKIPYLSYGGRYDIICNPEQEKILTYTTNKKHVVFVFKKYDGTNVGVTKINDILIPLVRSGYTALSSPYKIHHYFHRFVMDNSHIFSFMKDK